jgi:diacylglycerol kinase (ATP)
MRSFYYAFRGIRTLVVTQPNAWIHAAATVAVCGLGLFLGLSAPEWCWIVLAMMAVWTAEGFNTALEFLTDLAAPGFQPLAGKTKDVAAGAVLISAIGSVVIGLLVLGPHVLRWFSGMGS